MYVCLRKLSGDVGDLVSLWGGILLGPSYGGARRVYRMSERRRSYSYGVLWVLRTMLVS